MAFDAEQIADSQELMRYNQALGAATPEPPVERHMPDWYMNYRDDIENLKHALRNEYYDPKDKKLPWKPGGRALMSESGINLFIGFLSNTSFSKNLAMTNFPNYQIALENSLDICLSVNTWLHKHYALRDIGLDVNDISYINDMMRAITKAACLGAYMAGGRRRVESTSRTSTQYVGVADSGQPPNPQQGGFAGNLFSGILGR